MNTCGECDTGEPCPPGRCLEDEAWCANTRMELEEEAAFEREHGSLG